jgi:hypothetical protein
VACHGIGNITEIYAYPKIYEVLAITTITTHVTINKIVAIKDLSELLIYKQSIHSSMAYGIN